jgi:small GTP-binding protein
VKVSNAKDQNKNGRGQRSRGGLLGGISLNSLSTNIDLVRKFMRLTDWKALHDEVQGEMRRTVAIVGMPNTGKSTLFNTLRGRHSSAVSPVAGTTTTPIRGAFGPFNLIDTPGHLRGVQLDAVDESAVVLLLLDASRGLRPEDHDLLHELRRTGKPLVVALNKIDALTRDPDHVAGEYAAQLSVQDIIPISATVGTNVGEELVPALIDASPEAALAIGLALPGYRRTAADRMVRNATLVGLAAGMEPIPLLDIPILLGNQIRLVLRIAAVYGEPMTIQHMRELGTTIAAGLALRYVAEEAAKLVPIGGDLVSGLIAAAGTWAIGQVAIEYFEGGKRLSRRQLNEMFSRYYRRYRQDSGAREVGQLAPALQGALPPPSLEREQR